MSVLAKTAVTKGNLSFSFEECFDNNEVRRQMREFCNELNSEELILFVQALEEFSKLRGSSNKALKLYEMYKSFVMESSSLCLNLKTKTREEIHEKFCEHVKQFLVTNETSSENQSTDEGISAITSYDLLVSTDVFDQAEREVMDQLKNRIFPLFLKTPLFDAYIKKNTESLDQLCSNANSSSRDNTAEEDLSSFDVLSGEKDSSGIRQLDGTISVPQFINQVMDLKPQVFEKDITSLLSIAYSESIWKLDSAEEVYSVFTADDPRGQYHAIMITGSVPYNLDLLLRAVSSKEYRSAQDKNLLSTQEIQYTRAITPYARDGSKELSTLITKETFKFQWPLSNREFVLANTVVFLKPSEQYQERYVHMYKSTVHVSAPKSKGVTTGLSSGGFICEKINEHESRYHQVIFIDFKGWMSKKVVSSYFNNRGFQSHSTLMSVMAKFSKQSNTSSLTPNKLIDTLNDYRFNHLQALKKKQTP